MPPVLSESQLLRSQDKVEPIVGAAGRVTAHERFWCCRPAAERSLGSELEAQTREMALQMETLAAHLDVTHKQCDALHGHNDDAEMELAKALQQRPRLRDLGQAHVSCASPLQEEQAARQAAQYKVRRLKETEVLH